MGRGKTVYGNNKESEKVQAYLQGLLSVEGVQQFLQDNKEAKSWLDSTVDKRTTKSIETWKSNHLEQLIEEEVKARFPDKRSNEEWSHNLYVMYR